MGKITLADINGRNCKMAAVINAPALFLNMTAFENLKEQFALLGLHDDTIISNTLKTVGLEDYADKKVKGFSLGMTQRLKLGMALLESPDLLILDEPVNGLDPDGIIELRELLHQLNQKHGMTILVSSHILSELEHTATCFGILNDGKITKELSIQDIRLGMSIFGNLTTFVSAENVISLGVKYQKGLGLIAVIFISVFIGQEYQWNTWQHKWLISKTRYGIYLSKAILSAVVSALVFLAFEISALLFSGQVGNLLAGGYITTLFCGSVIYIALGAVLCFISMLIKNITTSVIVSLGFILFSETIMAVLQNIGSVSNDNQLHCY